MKINGLRWLMIGLVFLATVINYIDRQTVSVLKTSISQDLGLSNADYAAIQNSFLLFYGISQMVSGRLYDVIGTRLGFVFSIVVWSLAALAHATARTATAFGVFRAALGFGEAGNWPGAAKVVGEWFPVRERALGMGIFNTGAAVGGALSPPIIAWLATAYGWRMTFVLTGVLGFIWLALWLVLFQTPARHRWITEGERAHILDGAAPTAAGPAWRPGWIELLRYRQTWAVVLGRFITDPIWWLYIFWLPSYLQEARGFSLQQVGQSAWLPFLAAGIGALSGGYASGALISRGWSVDRARKVVMGVGALLTSAGILAMRAPRSVRRAGVDVGRALRLPGLGQQPPDACRAISFRTPPSARCLDSAAPPQRWRASCSPGAPARSLTRSATHRCFSPPASSAPSGWSSPWHWLDGSTP